MLWQSSYFIWSSLCLLTLDRSHVSSGVICKPGSKASHTRTNCEPCPTGQYNPRRTDSNECLNCEPCVQYSIQVSACTPTSNTKCRCIESFTPFDKRQQRCRCSTGSVIKTLENGKKICEKCPSNTFINTITSECQVLTKFSQSGEKFPGNATTDVNTAKTVALTSSPLSLTQTSNTSTMTPTTNRNSVSTPTASIPEPQDIRKHSLWLAFLVAFLLLILILKLSICPKKKIDIVRQGSACRKPVEESGEKFLSIPPLHIPALNIAMSQNWQ